MKLRITKQKADFNRCSIRNKLCVMVEFPNCISSTTKRSFKWMPTYTELREIEKALAEVEKESWR